MPGTREVQTIGGPGRAVHIWLDHTMHEATFFGAFKKALAPGTNRDLKVVTALDERWGA